LALDGAGTALAANLIGIACSSCCVHASIAVGRVTKRHPIAVIPPVAGRGRWVLAG